MMVRNHVMMINRCSSTNGRQTQTPLRSFFLEVEEKENRYFL